MSIRIKSTGKPPARKKLKVRRINRPKTIFTFKQLKEAVVARGLPKNSFDEEILRAGKKIGVSYQELLSCEIDRITQPQLDPKRIRKEAIDTLRESGIEPY